jgi:hypothetical protein
VRAEVLARVGKLQVVSNKLLNGVDQGEDLLLVVLELLHALGMLEEIELEVLL